MKKHTLEEHHSAVWKWALDTNQVSTYDPKGVYPVAVFFFTAYERWLNDRELLTVENGNA